MQKRTGWEGLVSRELSVTSGVGLDREAYWAHPNPDSFHKNDI